MGYQVSQPTILQSIDAVRRRSTEAMIAISGLKHAGLAAEIRRKLGSIDRADGALQPEPVIEPAPPYVEADVTMGELAGSLLSPQLVDALDGGPAAGDRPYRFLREWRPYAHQLEAWRALRGEPPRSVLVASGTGSGKTECFLVPILDDLARQAAAGTRLEGVQALILYPLNALIASQEERLSVWTRPFAPAVRFGLYNGLTPKEDNAGVARQRPEMAVDRETLRASPPPILVTNVTMLEYILLRSIDQPIVNASKGKLRYVVLDEAHTYVGAGAAEIALLLRRVCLAFGVEPANVRFIATSATIGGENVEKTLAAFISDVGGAPPERAQVIVGRTREPSLPAPSGSGSIAADWLESAAPEQLFDRLAAHAKVRPLLEALAQEPQPLSRFDAVGQAIGLSGGALAGAIGAARRGDDALGPLRIHAFHRTSPGLWSCLDQHCSQPRATDWPFGGISTDEAERCRCGAPTFEIHVCRDCGEPFVRADETAGGRLSRPSRLGGLDEFETDTDGDDNTEAEAGAQGGEAAPPLSVSAIQRWLCLSTFHGAVSLYLDPRASEVRDRPADGLARVHAADVAGGACPACASAPTAGGPSPVRPFRFGAPFVLANAAPLLLQSAAAAERAPSDVEVAPPSGGRQILTFTDSRQGTARFAAKLQVGAERNFVRAFVYHAVQDVLSKRSAGGDPALRGQIDILEQLLPDNPGLEITITNLRAEAEKQETGLAWPELTTRLAERPEVYRWVAEIWEPRNPERYKDPARIANFLLLREFLRRPRRANTLETLGLARLEAPLIRRLPAERTPSAFMQIGGSADDWKDFLSILLTYLLRGNGAVRVEYADRHWIQPHGVSRGYVRDPAAANRATGDLAWPQPMRGRQSRPITLLIQAFGLSLEDKAAREVIAECMDEAWRVLSPLLQAPAARNAQLGFEHLTVSSVTSAWVCPVSRRLLDVSLRGLSPYGAERAGLGSVAEKVEMPRLPKPFLDGLKGENVERARDELSEWLTSDPAVQALRERGLWGDISDELATFNEYFRSAEHSAQQPPERLRRYERQFREGRVNVLNCSTTMEMGVDIGSVSQVLNTNLPPSIANYRQRVGRAGRRRQPLALGFTLCKDRPLDRDAFADPISFLRRQVRAPRVALDSGVIVQRHVNAWLFGRFAHDHIDEDAVKLQAGGFFGCPSAARAPPAAEPPASLFLEWLARPSTAAQVAAPLAVLVRGSVLEGDPSIQQACADALKAARDAFVAEWSAIQQLLQERPADRAATRGLEIQLRRLCEDYLLSALSGRGFLPSHGFPTGVVPFVIPGDAGRDLGPEEAARFRSYPKRSLDVALREYSPGAEIVLDGLVYRSAGVTLNWKRPAREEDAERDIQNLFYRWICRHCGESESSRHLPEARACPSCGQAGVSVERVLQPAGFRCNYNETPHADTDLVSFVPADPPRVSARGEPWSSLIDPSLGRHRSNRTGSVFYCCSGPDGRGYDICLYCGRAEPTPADPRPGGRWEHKPLVGKPDVDGLCGGSLRPFALQQELRLGYETSTDVFEMQAAGVNGLGSGLAFASAMREALAQLLGIEPEALGIAAALRLGPHGARTVSAYLFDRASGGAGYAIQASTRWPELLPLVERRLDCQTPGCVTGCPSCVLAADLSEEEARILDRQSALSAVLLLASEARPRPADRASPGCWLVRDLVDALNRLTREGARQLTTWFGAPLDVSGLQEVAARLEPLRLQGGSLRLALRPGTLETLDGASRLLLRDVSTRLGAAVSEVAPPAFANGARAVATAASQGGSATWFASCDEQIDIAGPDWGRPSARALVGFQSEEAPAVGRAVEDLLRPPPGGQLLGLVGELDGALGAFGADLAERLLRLGHDAGLSDTATLRTVTYADAYLRSPLTLSLCLQTIAALAPRIARTPVQLLTRPLDQDRNPYRVDHDWRLAQHRREVARRLGAKLDLNVSLSEDHQEHARRMELEFDDGPRLQILFDQGFGPWRCDAPVAFDFSLDPQGQCARLLSLRPRLRQANRTWMVVRLGG